MTKIAVVIMEVLDLDDIYRGFKGGIWSKEIDVRDFIKQNITPYTGGGEFLKGPTKRTLAVLRKYEMLKSVELGFGGVLDIDTTAVSSLTSYGPGYIDREREIIVGLQTDRPLRRGVNPFGGIRMARQACEAYGYKLSEKIENEFFYKTTHNDGVFRVYSEEMKAARRCGLITGLPDAYGRGRIIGDYRRVALYGVDRLMASKEADKAALARESMCEENIRRSEELYKQLSFLGKLKEMAALYGFDISGPAKDAKEAVQWLYFAYLGAIKEQNGAAMSLGRVSSFLDIYIERDIAEGTLDETRAQELMDDFVLKLRMARHLRTPEYSEMFGGDPMWITESVGGISQEGSPLVTKSSFRILHTLRNLGAAPEPNLTVLWSEKLPEPFKRYCAALSIETDALQYESDDLMRPDYGDDYSIACCVSAMRTGKQMQYFGARCNLPKLLLLSLNGGYDTGTGAQIAPEGEVFKGDILDYDILKSAFLKYQSWLCALYVNTMNIIHFMHDKYAYEKLQMALHDTEVERLMAFGIAGLSVAADSFSAVKYGRVRALRDEKGYITGFETGGEYPCFGNDDDRADEIAAWLAGGFLAELKKTPCYRGARHTLSLLTITANVAYGKKTGATPDGRRAGEPFAPGANPMSGREREGALAALNSVAKLPYGCCQDGISNTFSIVPEALGHTQGEREQNLAAILDGYFKKGAHHINVNVLHREELLKALTNPELYPNLTIRVSGYAVNFCRLSREQQREVAARTFHGAL